MENEKSWCDYFVNSIDGIDFSTVWNRESEMNPSSSSETFPFNPCAALGDQRPSELQVGDQQTFASAIMPSSSSPRSPMVSPQVHHLPLFDGCHSIDQSRNGGEEDELRPIFFNIDAAGDLHLNAISVTTSFNTESTRYRPSLNRSSPLPSPDPDLFEDFLVAEDSSLNLRIQEYNPATGVWEICTDSSFSLHGSTHHKTYYKDSEDRDVLCSIGVLDAEGTKGVVMYDMEKKQLVQSAIKRPIPLVRSELGLVPRLVTAHILGCGGFIFVYSEQEIRKEVFSVIHKFNPDNPGGGMWEQLYNQLKMIGGVPDLQTVHPEFTTVRPLSATMAECGGSTFVFCEQELGKEVFISILVRKRNGCGHGLWEEVMWRKRKRYRGPNFRDEEKTAFLKYKVEALEAVKGKPDWYYISKSLQKAGFKRSPKACEDLWGTLLKHLTKIKEYVQENHIPGPSSTWTGIWNMSEKERADKKLPRVFTFEWYQMMEIIHGTKPRKIGGKKKQLQWQANGNASTSLTDSTVTSANSSGLMAIDIPASVLAIPSSTTPLSTGQSSDDFVDDEEQTEEEGRGAYDVTSEVSSLCNYLLQDRINLTNNQIAKKRDEALKIVKLKLEVEYMIEKNKARLVEPSDNRPRKKSRKTK